MQSKHAETNVPSFMTEAVHCASAFRAEDIRHTRKTPEIMVCKHLPIRTRLGAALGMISLAVGPVRAADAPLRYFVTSSASMAPTIVSGQLLGVDLNYYKTHAVRPNDVIVFSPPTATDIPYVKRVIAIPGDRLLIQDGKVIRNGVTVGSPFPAPPYVLAVRDFRMYIDGEPLGSTAAIVPPSSMWKYGGDRVPTGCYIVLGDNRRISADSHVWGFLCPDLPGLPGSRPSIDGRVLTKMVPI